MSYILVCHERIITVFNILSNVYADRKISTELAYSISNEFSSWKDTLPAFLHRENTNLPDEDFKMTLAQLHVNSNHFHGSILLTRPFFLPRVSDEIRAKKNADSSNPSRQTYEMPATDSVQTALFQKACVRTALYTINVVQAALLNRALPRRDQFVM